jgi:hypothetical protein
VASNIMPCHSKGQALDQDLLFNGFVSMIIGNVSIALPYLFQTYRAKVKLGRSSEVSVPGFRIDEIAEVVPCLRSGEPMSRPI